MNLPKLYRRRFIPDETVLLKDDLIVHMDENIIVTKWSVLKPRKDFTHGISCYYLKEGYKISRFYNKENQCIYTYCDIIETIYNESDNSYIFNDLLADVIIYADGFVKVMDIEELPEAYENNLITIDQMKDSLRQLNSLLTAIYDGNLEKLTQILDSY